MMPRPLFSIAGTVVLAGTLVSAVVIAACIDPSGAESLPAGLAIRSGDGQSGSAGQPLPRPLVVTVGDVNGHAVHGAAIAWEVSSGGGAIPFIAYTDATGRASATWTLGVEGLTQTVQAKVSFFADSSPGPATPVTFRATANGAATELLLVAGNNQAAIIDDTLPVPLRIRAVNQSAARVAGVRVFWTAAGGGQVFPSPAVTDAQGDAVATWVLGATVGTQTATATAAGLTGSPTFTATANAAANTLNWVVEQLPSITECASGGWWRVWASSPTDVFVVGSCGAIRHFNGSAWELQASGTTNHLLAVWGNSPSDVFAAGDSVTIVHYDGSTWSPHVTGAGSCRFAGLWGSSPRDVFAVGASQATFFSGIWHFDGNAWSLQLSTSQPPCLQSVWGSSPSDVFAVGAGLVFHYDGTAWSNQPSASSCRIDAAWTGLWGSGPSDVYAVGYQVGSVRTNVPRHGTIHRYDGTMWREQLTVAEDLIAVWVASIADVVAVGASGLILHYDGTRWRREASGTTESIIAVSGTSPLDLWAITRSGLVLHGTR